MRLGPCFPRLHDLLAWNTFRNRLAHRLLVAGCSMPRGIPVPTFEADAAARLYDNTVTHESRLQICLLDGRWVPPSYQQNICAMPWTMSVCHPLATRHIIMFIFWCLCCRDSSLASSLPVLHRRRRLRHRSTKRTIPPTLIIIAPLLLVSPWSVCLPLCSAGACRLIWSLNVSVQRHKPDSVLGILSVTICLLYNTRLTNTLVVERPHRTVVSWTSLRPSIVCRGRSCGNDSIP
jgi:hypothetical protein